MGKAKIGYSPKEPEVLAGGEPNPSLKSVPQAVKEILDLVAPELGLILDVFFIGKILDQEDRLVGDVGFFNAEFKIFFFGGIGPVKTDELLQFAFQDLGLGRGTIPGETENIVAFVNFIGKPFLQTGGGT